MSDDTVGSWTVSISAHALSIYHLLNQLWLDWKTPAKHQVLENASLFVFFSISVGLVDWNLCSLWLGFVLIQAGVF